jgi:hypothetical protein
MEQPMDAGGMDADVGGDMDAMADADVDMSDGGDADVIPPPLSDAGDDTDAGAGPAPKGWTCPKEFWNDTICDCGCGVRDWDKDCMSMTCTEPGCRMDSCDACFSVSGAWTGCEDAPDPMDWLCDAIAYDQPGATVCDCGCGIADPDCLGQGCTEGSCRTPRCNVLWDGKSPAAKLPSPAPNPPIAWQIAGCPWDAWGGGNGCDCGCGIDDPDCGVGAGCTTVNCNHTFCETCHDRDGRPIPCDDELVNWAPECNPNKFGAGDGCDCGCGVPDPDCDGKGCTDGASGIT